MTDISRGFWPQIHPSRSYGSTWATSLRDSRPCSIRPNAPLLLNDLCCNESTSQIVSELRCQVLARSGLKHCFNDGHFERVLAANTSVAELRIYVGDVAPRLASLLFPTQRPTPSKRPSLQRIDITDCLWIAVSSLGMGGLKHCFNNGHFERVSAANTSVAELRIYVGDVAPRLASLIYPTQRTAPTKRPSLQRITDCL